MCAILAASPVSTLSAFSAQLTRKAPAQLQMTWGSAGALLTLGFTYNGTQNNGKLMETVGTNTLASGRDGAELHI